MIPSPEQLEALRLAEGLAATPAHLERVSKATSAEAARWAFEQWSLRERAKGRLPAAEHMLFVREALEQATHAELATYHASLFPTGEPVVDLTCGIGGDLVEFARRGPALGFELDAERAAYARWNLEALGLTGEVRNEDGLAWLLENPSPYVFADPARRVQGRRTLDPSDFSPNPGAVAEASQAAERYLVKLTPMQPDESLARLGRRIEFVSIRGECREALVIGGRDVEGGVFAIRPGLPPLEGDRPEPVEAEAAEDWLYDADPAAVRAHALGGLAEEFDLRALGDAPGYLTGQGPVNSSWLRGYRVIEEVAPKRLKAALNALGAGAPVLKQRGARQDLDVWRKTLGQHGSRPVAVAFYTRGEKLRAIILSNETA